MSHTDKAPHQPQRMCIGCRHSDDQVALIRLHVRAVSGTDTPSVHVDTGARAGGRGAWLHPNQDCFQRALKSRGFARAFRGQVDTTALAAEFTIACSATENVRDQHESGSKI
ncbi:YlxR family protein [Micrococcoides hystricis]|uniref:YlxR family protein n=1 Tax=Micrococcoides hystricis TaxID=1572761 RepID=A0ABV6PA48_9MICC